MYPFTPNSHVGGDASPQGFDSDNRRAVIAAHPERDRIRRIVHEHSSDVRGPGKEVLARLTRLRIQPQHAVIRY